MTENNWLEPLDRRIKQVQKEIEYIKKETAALATLHRIYTENGDAMKRFADAEAWEAYCEASLDLSNQDDVDEDTEEDEDYKNFKDFLQKIKDLTYEKLVELMGEEWIEDYRQSFP
jgi:hypothetical protein